MSESDWEPRYVTGDMPWEKGEASPGLVDFLARQGELARGHVAVPGCGTGHDVSAWAQAGFQANGFDLAPSVIHIFLAIGHVSITKENTTFRNYTTTMSSRRKNSIVGVPTVVS